MSTTVNASPIHSIVEATQYKATPESAWEIMAILRAGAAAANNSTIQLSYSENPGQPSGLYLYIDGNGYNLTDGDWLIKDDLLFSVCPAQNFAARYATEAALS
jgi:hypothetical protein